jgi:ribonuclease HII
VIKGDATSLSIAAASVVAKVERDRLMQQLDADFPQFAWKTNMGYGTREHAEALKIYGVTPHHRRSFRPIRDMLCLPK